MTADHPVRPWVVTDPCTCTKPGRAPDLSPATSDLGTWRAWGDLLDVQRDPYRRLAAAALTADAALTGQRTTDEETDRG